MILFSNLSIHHCRYTYSVARRETRFSTRLQSIFRLPLWLSWCTRRHRRHEVRLRSALPPVSPSCQRVSRDTSDSVTAARSLHAKRRQGRGSTATVCQKAHPGDAWRSVLRNRFVTKLGLFDAIASPAALSMPSGPRRCAIIDPGGNDNRDRASRRASAPSLSSANSS